MAMLIGAVQQMLKERELPDDAINWIIQDIPPRLAFLDGRFPPEIVLGTGSSPIFARAMTKALQEILKLEIELYYEKRGPKAGVGYPP
ncbi:hypothetical protein [Methylocystis parvus]|uniref:hypothetical protein n=1 Tax=Methylocystis parvus TaxID=134 RepID=UPI003C74423B